MVTERPRVKDIKFLWKSTPMSWTNKSKVNGMPICAEKTFLHNVQQNARGDAALLKVKKKSSDGCLSFRSQSWQEFCTWLSLCTHVLKVLFDFLGQDKILLWDEARWRDWVVILLPPSPTNWAPMGNQAKYILSDTIRVNADDLLFVSLQKVS